MAVGARSMGAAGGNRGRLRLVPTGGKGSPLLFSGGVCHVSTLGNEYRANVVARLIVFVLSIRRAAAVKC